MTTRRLTCLLTTLGMLPVAVSVQPARYSFDDAQRFLKTQCQACNHGTAPPLASN
jgi:hypothetical protein